MSIGKLKKLRAAGWKVGSAKDFLSNTRSSISRQEFESARKRLRARRYERPLDPVIDPGEWDASR